VDGVVPRRRAPYRIPESLKPEVDRQLDQLLADGLIKEVTSPWCHSIVCVEKPGKSLRLCVDYREVNKYTVADSFPMPRVDVMLERLSHCDVISTLDASSGFWQIPVHPDSIEKTAFVTHRGQFAWTVLSFGLKNASATFQRAMDRILAPHKEYAGAYIDDTGVGSKGFPAHLIHLERVLQAFQDAGVTLKLSKCNFAMSSVKFVGHVVGSGVKVMDSSRVDAIKSMQPPDSKKKWRSFIGLVSYYRDYLPSLSDILKPITDLTKKDAPEKCVNSEKVLNAFNELKKALSSPTVLHSVRYDRDFLLQADSSDYAVGACLSQIDDHDRERPVAFASSKLSDTQRRWSTIEKEAYAILFALRKFDSIVYGFRIRVQSDHNPLRFLSDSVPKSSKLVRWQLALNRYNLTIEHRRGSLHTNCDSLSRLFNA
jgi:hypothetical protein